MGGGEGQASFYPSKTEWDLTNGPRSVSCDRAIRYSGLGVRSIRPVGDFLDFMFKDPLYCYRVLKGWCSRGGGNWGTLRIPAGKIGED